MSNAKSTTDATFAADTAGKLALVDVWAPWCGPCRALGPTVDAVAAKYAGRVEVVKLDCDDNPEVSDKFAIKSIPTLLVLRNGVEVARMVGSVSENVIAAALDKALKAG